MDYGQIVKQPSTSNRSVKANNQHAWWQSITTIAIGWTLTLSILMIGVIVGSTAIALYWTTQTIAQRHHRITTHLLAERLSDNLRQNALALTVVARHPSFISHDATQIQQVFQQYDYLLADLVAMGDIVLLDEHGQVTASYPSDAELMGQDYAASSYFQILQIDISYEPIFFHNNPSPSGKWEGEVAGIAISIYDESKQFRGCLVNRFYLGDQQLGKYINGFEDWSGETYLIDRLGHVIFHADKTLIGSSFDSTPQIEKLHQSNKTWSDVVQLEGGNWFFISYAPIKESGWGIVMVESWADSFRLVKQTALFISLILIVGISGITMLTLWATRRMTNRLNLLITQASIVASGNYDTQVSLSRISEIQELGLAFNYMVRQLRSYRRGLQEYVASVTNSQEDERKRIARDLHDGTLQTLIAIGQRIALVRDALDEQPVAKSQEQLTEVRGMVTESVNELRRFSRDLRPLVLEDLGLVPALFYLIGRLQQKADISADLEVEGEAIGLHQNLEIAIFRIVQEALNNILKHAQASQVIVTARFLPRQTILEIRDNGKGFVVPQDASELAHSGSFGLMGLEERAQLFGGDISIQSARDEGTIVRVILPHKHATTSSG
ncbi:MAG: hypothetical protein B6242_02725 [Anaerolineaceae bacterium 4572_78]|nr:MAG: hypothetical protein B6242_02725 [Anaerolineaceae bacterium 4572_78]